MPGVGVGASARSHPSCAAHPLEWVLARAGRPSAPPSGGRRSCSSRLLSSTQGGAPFDPHFRFNAGGGSRTHTPLSGHGILSPARIAKFRHPGVPVARLEARIGIEPMHKGFADPRLATWLPRPRSLHALAGSLPRLPFLRDRNANRLRTVPSRYCTGNAGRAQRGMGRRGLGVTACWLQNRPARQRAGCCCRPGGCPDRLQPPRWLRGWPARARCGTRSRRRRGRPAPGWPTRGT